ncbi:PepSY domain-containing protein [Niallia nealsonii]|nr:PepSY domain-containing protein [Niallia nealsonii]
MRNKWTKISIGLATVLGLASAGYYIGSEQKGFAAENPISVMTAQTNVSKEEAAKIASEKTNKTVEEMEIEVNSKGEKLYQVEFLEETEHDDDEIYINADTGDVLTKETMQKNIKVTEEQAKEAALKKAPGTVMEIELDEEAGQYYYDIEIVQKNGQDVDVEISAETGKVLHLDND